MSRKNKSNEDEDAVDSLSARERAALDVLDDQRQMSRPEEFRFDAYQAAYWDINTGFLHKEPKSINALIPVEYWPRFVKRDEETGKEKEVLIKPATWLANVSNNFLVDTSTWWPGKDRLIEGFLAIDGAMITDDRRIMFNTYRPPPQITAAPKIAKRLLGEAERWADHVKELWPDPIEHNFLFDYCAHMIQFPHIKANSILTLSGEQGIGKDMALVPVKSAVGNWNVRDITPDDIASNYNPWAQCVMLVVNEMKPTKEDFYASNMYEKLKTLAASPPDTIAISDKYMRQRHIVNVLRIFITTNKMQSMYIDGNDRRMRAVLHSPKLQGWREPSYFEGLADWIDNRSGALAVAIWLAARDLKAFKPKATPAATEAWKAVVSGWAPPQDAVATALDMLREPDAFFSAEMLRGQFDGVDDIRNMLKTPRRLQHRLQMNGYFMRTFLAPMEFKSSSPAGRGFKSKLAFIKQSLMHEEQKYMAILTERGRLIADEVAILNQSLPQQQSGRF